MTTTKFTTILLLGSFLFAPIGYAAEPVLIAIGTVSASDEDFATETAGPLENGIPGNRLGSLGSGLAQRTLITRPGRSTTRTPSSCSRLPTTTCLATSRNGFHRAHDDDRDGFDDHDDGRRW